MLKRLVRNYGVALFVLVFVLSACRSTPSGPKQIITVDSPYPHLAVGVPGKSDQLIDRPGYALGFLCKHKQACWVQYHLTADLASTKAAKRKNVFRTDPEITCGSATPDDYKKSGYDRGHLAPAADMAYSERTMNDSFYMSNMSPQKPQFNRDIWKRLEEQVRQFVLREKDVYIVTGPILPETKTITIGASKVTVPKYFYKVIYVRGKTAKMIGFILPNEESKKPLQSFAVSVDEIEKRTGLDFFSTVPQPEQDKLERTFSVKDWTWIPQY